VDDLVTALERGKGFGAEEVVGVGDQGGFHGGLSVGGSGGSGWFRPLAASKNVFFLAFSPISAN
jgi:hypothetical protein